MAPAPPFAEFVEIAEEKQLKEIGQSYLALLEKTPMADAALRITDKMLSNFELVGLIHLALPNARIIEHPHTYDLGELGRHYAAYRRLMAHWHEVLPPGVMIDVQYEALVADLETESRRIVAHCGLEWDERCLAFYDTERAVRTASAAQVRRPIYKSPTGRWKPSDELLAPLLAGLNNA